MTEAQEKRKPKSPFHKVNDFTPGIVAGDLAGALVTGFLAGSNAAVVDKSIMEKALEKTSTISEGLLRGYKKVFFAPHRFYLATDPPNHFNRVFQLCFLVYFSTYAAGNLTQSYSEAEGVCPSMRKFVNGSVVNVGLTLYKDNELLKILGKKDAPKIPVPNVSRALFVVRDCMTVLAAFWLSDLLALRFQQMFPKLTPFQCSDMADVLTPAAVQFVSTPLHLFAIKYHKNVELRKTPGKIALMIWPEYLPAAFARIGRIVPAFGVGMIVNRRIRHRAGEYAEGPNDSQTKQTKVE